MKAPSDLALRRLSLRVGRGLAEQGQTLVTAESCTGGWIAKVLTDVPGSSTWFQTGFVTYANATKTALLGVPSSLLQRHGAVSQAVVRRMASGALRRARSDLAIAVSGIAGPGGGSIEKPVGTVWFGLARREGRRVRIDTFQFRFDGGREAVRRQAVARALQAVLDR